MKNGKRKKNHALHALAKKRKEEEGEKEKENALAQNVKQDEGGEKEIISPCKQEKEESEENIQEVNHLFSLIRFFLSITIIHIMLVLKLFQRDISE